jgi:hypothetical protein
VSQDEVGRRYEDDAPPLVGSADLKQAAPDQLAYEPHRQPGVASETAIAAASGGGAIPANNTVPDQVSSVEEERSLRTPGIMSETACRAIRPVARAGAQQASPATCAPALNQAVPKRRNPHSILNLLPDRAASRQVKLRRQDLEVASSGPVSAADVASAAAPGARQNTSAAGAADWNQAPTKRRYGFSVADQLAARAARLREFKARPQHAEAASSGHVSPANVVSADVIEGLIRNAGASKMVIEGTNLSREYVFGMLGVHPLVYMVDPVAARAVAVFANEDDARAAWNHVTASSVRYGLTVEFIYSRSRGSTSIDLT